MKVTQILKQTKGQVASLSNSDFYANLVLLSSNIKFKTVNRELKRYILESSIEQREYMINLKVPCHMYDYDSQSYVTHENTKRVWCPFDDQCLMSRCHLYMAWLDDQCLMSRCHLYMA